MKPRIFKRSFIQLPGLNRIHLIERQGRDSIFHISDIIRDITLPPQRDDLGTHDYVRLIRIDTDRDAGHPLNPRKPVRQFLCMRELSSIQHQADHDLIRGKTIAEQYVTH